jgi:hypothetical protein
MRGLFREEGGVGVSLLERIRESCLERLARGGGISVPWDEPVDAVVLGTAAALGTTPDRLDFPLKRGKEWLLEAHLGGDLGQAFTGVPSPWRGTLRELFALSLEEDRNRALFLAGMNALGCRLGFASATKHCRDDEPEECAREMGRRLAERLAPDEGVLLVGYQPAILEAASEALGAERVSVLDLNPENIGRVVRGVEIRDGATGRLPSACGMALVTGSSLCNGTAEEVFAGLERAGIPKILFGTTAAAAAELMNWERWCFRAV